MVNEYQEESEIRNEDLLNEQGTEQEMPVEDEASVLMKELESEKQKAADNYDRYLRAVADGENQRKRWLKEKEEITRFANLSFVRKLLPVMDDFDRAKAFIDQGGDLQAVKKGVEMVEKRLVELVEQEGIKTIPAMGEQFDPQRHEALTLEDTDEYPDGTIIEVFQLGYQWNDRVVRPSLVKVAKGK
ncbi:MAG: nucleotide exchange factor GrpE [Ignavibacteriales bacterium]